MLGRVRRRLATRVSVAASALALFFVLCMGIGAWLATAGTIREQVRDLLRSEAAMRAERIADLLADLQQHVHILAADPRLPGDTGGAMLAHAATFGSMAVDLVLVDADGVPVRPVAWLRPDEGWVSAALAAGLTRGRVGPGPALEMVVPMVAARGSSKVAGALAWRLDLASLAERAGRSDHAVELILESDGRRHVHRKGTMAVDEELAVEVPVPLTSPLQTYRLSVRMVPDRATLDLPLGRLGAFFLAIGAASTLMVVLVSALMGRRLTQSLSRLADAAASFGPGRGDREAFLVPGEDEIARLGAAFAGLVDRVDRAYQDLERRGQTLLSNAERVARVGSAQWDSDGGRPVWSDQFHALLGYAPGQVVPTPAALLDRVHADDRARLVEALERVQSGASPRMVEDCRILHPGEGERVAQFRAELGRDSAGRPVRVDVTLQDITERKRMEERLDGAVRELERSNEELEQFAYVASHDLRQPLRTVRSYVTLIEESIDDRLDDETREFMDFIREGAKRMDALITDLLAYSRVGRASKDGLVDCGRAVDLALIDLQAEMDEARARIDMPQSLPVVSGDPGEMVRLFQNLIGNALKYRAADRAPVVALGVEDRGAEWEFFVRDNGIGVPPEHGDRIFGIFQRLHARHEYEGTGIGLAICRKVVERQGGRIWVEDSPGGGATFRFSWPKLRRGGLSQTPGEASLSLPPPVN